MPVVKTYLKYEAEHCIGRVASTESNTVLLADGDVAAPALQDVIVWSTRRGQEKLVLKGEEHEVTCLCAAPDNRSVAVGYNDGKIQVFSLEDGSAGVTFSGHRSAVTALKYEADGARLASGGRDTDVIVWDIINEAGLFRLRGHKGPVTELCFLRTENVLVSSSRDSFVKFWDLETQHCAHTLIGHRNEVTGFQMLRDETRIVTSSVDNELRVWALDFRLQLLASHVAKQNAADQGKMDTEDDIADVQAQPIVTTFVGSVFRKSHERSLMLLKTADERVLLCQSADKTVDVFRLRTEDEVAKKLKRKSKRLKEKQAQKKDSEDTQAQEPAVVERSIADEIVHEAVVRASAKIRSIDVATTKTGSEYSLAMSLNNNSLELHTLSLQKKSASSACVSALTHPGHRRPIRAVAMSSDSLLIATSSNTETKIWNRQTQRCIRTLPSGYGLCIIFCPGDRHVLVGTKEGHLQLFDLASGSMLEDVVAHTKAVWSIALRADGNGFVTGSADHTVKFWNFELESETGAKRLGVRHARTLKMSDEVLYVRFSPSLKLLAIALLDNTVKVFYADTLKFFLSLYGHRLPVLSLDFSSDSTLLATGSADKNVKIWGLDFGDCHKSFFAHQDAVTDVKFIGTTHYVFSCSKDKRIKQWDCDNFNMIQCLDGHHQQVAALAVSERGTVLASVSHDRSIRTWMRTREMLNPEEEQEMEREALYEKEQAEQEGREYRAKAGDEETTLPGKKSSETLKAAERLMEALDVADADAKRGPGEPVNPMILAYHVDNGRDFLRHVLASVRSSELEESMLVMPFDYVSRFLPYLLEFIKNQVSLERSLRCLLFLLKIHHSQISTQDSLLPLLNELRQTSKAAVTSVRDMIGFNLAGIRFLKRQLTETMVDPSEELQSKKKKTASA